jgi:ribosomal protein S27E
VFQKVKYQEALVCVFCAQPLTAYQRATRKTCPHCGKWCHTNYGGMASIASPGNWHWSWRRFRWEWSPAPIVYPESPTTLVDRKPSTLVDREEPRRAETVRASANIAPP